MKEQLLAQGGFFETGRPGSEDTGRLMTEALDTVRNSNWGQRVTQALSGGNSGGQDFQDIVNLVISTILNPLILLFLGLAVVYFMWGVFKYVGKGESESDRREGANMMMYGIVAIFVMVSVWGLVTILINTFGLSTSVPTVPALK